MSDLFAGLEGLGFTPPKIDNLFANNKQKEAEKVKVEIDKTARALMTRTHDCAVCEQPFENEGLRASQLKLVRTDTDLRPYYEPLDPLYYDVVMCPYCGYTALKGTFRRVSEKQKELILEKITPNFIAKNYPQIYETDHAIERYTFALYNAYVKDVKSSEKGFICLKLAWLYRDKNDAENELKFLKNALTGLAGAYSNESFPIFNMDENTLCYLLGELSRRCGDFAEALRYLSRVIVDRNVSQRLKDRAIDAKDMIAEHKKRLGIE